MAKLWAGRFEKPTNALLDDFQSSIPFDQRMLECDVTGSIAHAMFGCAVVAVINNGMNLLHIDSYWQKVVLGIIILLAVLMDMMQKKQKN